MARSHLKDNHVEPFTTQITIALAAGEATISVSPNSSLSSRISTIADTYSLYRFVSLSFTLIRSGTITSSTQVAAFIPGITDTKPATVSDASALLHKSIVSSIQTGGWQKCVVPRKALAGMQPWYKTVVGTPDPAAEVQGVIQVVGTGTDTITLWVSGNVEFMSPIAVANTPKAQLAYQMLHEERKRLACEAYYKSIGVKPPMVYSNPDLSNGKLYMTGT